MTDICTLAEARSAEPPPPVGLLDWLDRPSSTAGVGFLDGSTWRLEPYVDLAEQVPRAARQLSDAGVRPGDVVGVEDGLCGDFLVAASGALYLGATVMPLPAHRRPGPARDSDIAALRAAGGSLLVATPSSIAERAEPVARPIGDVQRMRVDRRKSGAVGRGPLAPMVLLQLTSGTSGARRAVKVTPENLEINLVAIAAWLQVGPGDSVAAWLPLNHDMGLVGTLLFSVVNQMTLWHLLPRQFLRDPAQWLHCISGSSSTLTAAPGFAYELLQRRANRSTLAKMDFQRLRSAIVAAERPNARALADFVAMLEPRGLSPTALRPAYGLAEATLAVTGVPTGVDARVVEVRNGASRLGETVEPADLGTIGTLAGHHGASCLVSCGRVLRGTIVGVVDENGAPLPDRTLGEVNVQGRSVANGYAAPHEEAESRFGPSGLRTGDAGFFVDGELFVLGRIAESVKARGRHVFAEDLELAIAGSLGCSPGQCAVIAAPDTEDTALLVILEDVAGDRINSVEALVRSRVGPSVAIRVCLAAGGTIRRTTSGKPRRREMWRAWSRGELEFAAVNAGPRETGEGPAAPVGDRGASSAARRRKARPSGRTGS